MSAMPFLIFSHFRFSQAFTLPPPQTLPLTRLSGNCKWSILLYPLRWQLHCFAGSIFPFSFNIFPNPTGNVSSLFFSHLVSTWMFNKASSVWNWSHMLHPSWSGSPDLTSFTETSEQQLHISGLRKLFLSLPWAHEVQGKQTIILDVPSPSMWTLFTVSTTATVLRIMSLTLLTWHMQCM